MSESNNPALPVEDDLPEQLRIRREKRAAIMERGAEAYPVSVPRTATLKAIREAHTDLPVDHATGITESVAGRVIFKRDTGKLCFATLREGDGTELQAMLSLDKVGENALNRWKSEIDLGDHVSVTGEVITSKRGELSILALHILFECVSYIDAEAIDAAIRPELQSLNEVELNFAVIPIKVWLFWCKEMQVPLTRSSIRIVGAGPCRWRKVRHPVIRWQFAILAFAIAEDIAIAFFRSWLRGEGLFKPDVMVG